MFLKDLFSRECSKKEANVARESGIAEAAAMGHSKTIETSQESSREDQRTSRTLEQEEELPFLEANWFIFTLAMYCGFHNVRRNSSGELENSYWGLLPILLQFVIGIAGFLVVQYLYWFTDLEYYQGVMLLPNEFGFGFCIDAYFSTILCARNYINYLSEIEAQDVRMKPFKNMSFVIAGILVSSIIYTACTLIVTNLSTKTTSILIIPVLHTSLLPSLLDMSMLSFNLMLRQEVVKLRERMRLVSQWTRTEVSGVASKWLQLCRLFRLHNHVFRKPLHSRSLQSMVQVMAFTYGLVMIDVMMDELTSQTSRVVVILSVLVPLLWTFVRSISLAFNGEVINNAYEGVLDEVRAVVVRGIHSREGRTELHDLRRLLGHMEARQLALQIWGRDDLGAGVFVQNTGLVLTYLVMVVQMQPMPDPNSKFTMLTDWNNKTYFPTRKMGFNVSLA